MAAQKGDELAAERLDRYEREARKRRWDSTIMPAIKVVEPDRDGRSRLIPLELLTERLDRLEADTSDLARTNRGLVQTVNRLDGSQRRWRYTALVLAAALAVQLVGSLAGRSLSRMFGLATGSAAASEVPARPAVDRFRTSG